MFQNFARFCGAHYKLNGKRRINYNESYFSGIIFIVMTIFSLELLEAYVINSEKFMTLLNRSFLIIYYFFVCFIVCIF